MPRRDRARRLHIPAESRRRASPPRSGPGRTPRGTRSRGRGAASRRSRSGRRGPAPGHGSPDTRRRARLPGCSLTGGSDRLHRVRCPTSTSEVFKRGRVAGSFTLDRQYRGAQGRGAREPGRGLERHPGPRRAVSRRARTGAARVPLDALRGRRAARRARPGRSPEAGRVPAARDPSPTDVGGKRGAVRRAAASGRRRRADLRRRAHRGEAGARGAALLRHRPQDHPMSARHRRRRGPASRLPRRAEPPGVRGPIKPADPGAWRRTILPDDVLLFRFSALTFNGHRIHYDHRYATEQEGYPGLVVHGPLIATLLLDLLRRRLPEASPSAFTFKALRPTFDISPFDLDGEPDPAGGPVRLWSTDNNGEVAVEAEAVLK